jgi:hypothetical protein
MDDPEITTEDRLDLRRRVRPVLLVLAIAGVVGIVGGFALGQARHAGHLGDFRLVSGLILAPAFLALAWLQFQRPAPRGKAGLIFSERWDRRTLWVVPGLGLLGLAMAALDIASARFHVGMIGLPLVVVCHLLARYRRIEDDFGREVAARAMMVGFVAAAVGLCGLVVVGAAAPEWLRGLASMALAAPVAIAATTFAVLMARGYRET